MHLEFNQWPNLTLRMLALTVEASRYRRYRSNDLSDPELNGACTEYFHGAIHVSKQLVFLDTVWNLFTTLFK